MSAEVARIVAFATVLALTGSARANGRMPGANDLVVAPADPAHLLLRATFGIAQSFDAGRTWSLVCEEAIGTSGVIADPPVTITGDGTLVLLPPTGGALVSHDRGCSFVSAPPPLAGTRGADLTRDPSDPRRVLVLTSTVMSVDARGFTVVQNTLVETRDDARTFRLLATLPTDFEAETVEVAPSDAQRIYVSGTASDNPLLGVLFTSSDGGVSWSKSTLALPAGSGSLFVSAVHPLEPDQLWVRVPARGDTIGILPARLFMSRDRGQSFVQLAATTRAMFGFALSPDGRELAYGGPADGLYVGPSDGSGSFEKVSQIGVRCLRWTAQGALFACGTEPMDAFSLGSSLDRGRAFMPLYRLVDTCPQLCADTQREAALCQQAWPQLAQRVGASTTACAAPWAKLDASVPLVSDAGPSGMDAAGPSATPDASMAFDAGAAGVEEAMSDGCSCSIATSGPRRHPLALLLALSGVVFALRRRAKWLLLALSLWSCGDAGDDQSEQPVEEGSMYAGCPETTPTFAIDMEAAGTAGRIRARLRAASPAPPARYRNDWRVDFLNAQGEVLTDVTILRARPFMPVHGHDGNVQPTWRAQGSEFALDYLNLNMRGPWEIQLGVRSAALGEDAMVFHVCVAE